MLHQPAQQFAAGWAVIDDENLFSFSLATVLVADRSDTFRVLSTLEYQGKAETTAFPGFAFDANRTAHTLHQLGRDGQSQPGSTEFSRDGTIRLLERLEDLFLIFLGNSPARIRHLKSHGRFLFAALQTMQS